MPSIDPLSAFWFQVIVLIAYIPLSYIAYRWVRVPLKRGRVTQSLTQLGVPQTPELSEMIQREYHFKQYFWPLLAACAVTFITFNITHPYIIERRFWYGVLESIIDIFGVDGGLVAPLPTNAADLARELAMGRVLFWGWLGAWVYSFHLTFRRFLMYDLTPSVYVFTANRFILAFFLGAALALGLGLTLKPVPQQNFDTTFAVSAVVAFCVGFFPEQGINWLAATGKRLLRRQEGVVNEIRLSEVEGISIWQQARLVQEGIDNVQNLAAADLPALVVGTPFTVDQIVDWVDQAILMTYCSRKQFAALVEVGVRCASDALTASGEDGHLAALSESTGLGENNLRMLHLSLESASNIRVVSHFRWQSSMDEDRIHEAALLRTTRPVFPAVGGRDRLAGSRPGANGPTGQAS